MNIFERASRAKTRFHSTKGMLSTEDLWSLDLKALDSIAKTVNKQLKEESEESFISPKAKETTELELQLEILKHVIASKQAAQEAAKKGAETKAQIERLETILLTKKEQELGNLSTAEIEQKLAELRA